MATVTIQIKHQGKLHPIEVDPSTTGEDFKYQVYSLTAVEPERQKILLNRAQLKNDTDMSTLGLKEGQVIMMMGTPSGSERLLRRPNEKTKFVEDMTEAEAAQQDGATPAGLVNLGNTCYLNSTLQTLRLMPELQEELATYEYQRQPTDVGSLPQLDLTRNLKGLYKQMSETQEGFPPMSFLTALRTAFPQFAERAKNGHGYAQQDAEEAWSQIVTQLRQRLIGPKTDTSEGTSYVDRYMAGEMKSILECDEAAAREGGEQAVTTVEPFLKLNCHIDGETNHLRDGIANGLKEKIEKKSEVLDREAVYTRTSQISRLPKYLTVQFVRFFWRRDTQKKAKIMRKVTFPQELDVVEFCTEPLRKMLAPVRDKVREIQRDEEDITRARKKRKMNPIDGENAAPGANRSTSAKPKDDKKSEKKTDDKKKTDANGDTEMETYKTDAEIDAEKDASLLAAKKELHALIDPDLAKDKSANQSGLYELRGVVTHQGSSADSGHYTAYVKKTGRVDTKTGKLGEEDGKWWWFNDDKVSEVEEDKIQTLAGGGESHSALILLYKAVSLPTAEGVME